jgi:hypothetical protein
MVMQGRFKHDVMASDLWTGHEWFQISNLVPTRWVRACNRHIESRGEAEGTSTWDTNTVRACKRGDCAEAAKRGQAAWSLIEAAAATGGCSGSSATWMANRAGDPGSEAAPATAGSVYLSGIW